MHDNPIWIAEAYQGGERIERIAHVTLEDAREDMMTITSDTEVDHYRFDQLNLYLGEKERFVAELDDSTETDDLGSTPSRRTR